MKKVIQEILAEFYEGPLPTHFKRRLEVPQFPKSVRKALIFIGMRRVGKTYHMFQHMEDLLSLGWEKKQFLYINFEDDRLNGFEMQHFQDILSAYYELFPEQVSSEQTVFYFDEIQNIEGWEKFIRRLIDKEKMSIMITGSSAKSLSRDIATSLRGRSLSQEVYPLSFSEVLEYKGIPPKPPKTVKERAKLLNEAKDYLKRGGFPETLELNEHLLHQTLQSYVHATVFRDVIDRYSISQPHIVKLFLIHCLQNIAAPLSVTKVYKSFRSRGESLSRGSLYSYLGYFEDAYLLCTVPIFEFSTRKRQVNPVKIYAIDPGLISAYSLKPGMEHAAQFENAVYIHLRKHQFDSICYYLSSSRKEVDFVCQRPNGVIELYQACLDDSSESTKEREIQALVEVAKELQVNKGTLITLSHNEELKVEGIKISILSFANWVLK